MASHLTFKEREVLYRMNRKGSSKSEIAEHLGGIARRFIGNSHATRAVAAIAPSKPNARLRSDAFVVVVNRS